MRARRIFHGFAFLAALALPVAQGCGGDDASVNGTDSDGGGGGGDDGSTTGNDGSTSSDGSSNTDTGSTDAFCAAANDYVTRCSLTDSCSLAVAASCTSEESVFGSQFLGAYEACESMQPCPGPSAGSDGGTAAYDSCLQSHFGTPDTAAQQLATDFCAKCLPAVGACPAGFYGNPNAARLLELDDAILTEIDDSCAKRDGGAGDGGALSCGDEFTKCAKDIFETHDPTPAACRDR